MKYTKVNFSKALTAYKNDPTRDSQFTFAAKDFLTDCTAELKRVAPAVAAYADDAKRLQAEVKSALEQLTKVFKSAGKEVGGKEFLVIAEKAKEVEKLGVVAENVRKGAKTAFEQLDLDMPQSLGKLAASVKDALNTLIKIQKGYVTTVVGADAMVERVGEYVKRAALIHQTAAKMHDAYVATKGQKQLKATKDKAALDDFNEKMVNKFILEVLDYQNAADAIRNECKGPGGAVGFPKVYAAIKAAFDEIIAVNPKLKLSERVIQTHQTNLKLTSASLKSLSGQVKSYHMNTAAYEKFLKASGDIVKTNDDVKANVKNVTTILEGRGKAMDSVISELKKLESKATAIAAKL